MHFKITNKNVAKIITIRIKLEVAARFGISVCLLLSRFLHIFSMGILHVQIRIFILFIKLGQTPSFKYHSFKWFLHRHQCRDTHRHSHITNSCFLTNTRHMPGSPINYPSYCPFLHHSFSSLYLGGLVVYKCDASGYSLFFESFLKQQL